MKNTGVVRIVNETGLINDTKIYIDDKELTNVTECEILPISADFKDGCAVKCKLTLLNIRLDIKGKLKNEDSNIDKHDKK